MANIILIIAGSIYLLIVIFALIYFLATISGKKGVMPRNRIADDYEQPFVSIIIPTYNESRNIVNCLQSLKALNYTNYEIIVSDGDSPDGTAELAKEYADKLIIDPTVPDGWIGKNWGCHLGYKEAKGEYLLFCDADTDHTPDSLRYFIKAAIERNSALLSVFPFQRIEKWWESINPFFYFASNLIYGGKNSVNNPDKLESFTASGQYMLFKRSDYETLGGHERIKGSIIEDYAFARITKLETRRLYFIDGTKKVYTRMYPDSPKQWWNGWKKCLFPGTKMTWAKRITGALLFFLWGLFAPVAIGITAAYTTWPFIVAAVLLYIGGGLGVLFYWNKKGKHLWMTYVFYPFGVIMFCLLLAVSALELLIKKETTWRGRKYKPNLFAGSRYEENENIVSGTNRIAQLETDIEIELDDKVISESSKPLERLPLQRKAQLIEDEIKDEQFEEPELLINNYMKIKSDSSMENVK
ncbi:MAG: glycosyltransferase [Asgard group archaeon]|nr:glycosyltransferase [Asgard group archaeon]